MAQAVERTSGIWQLLSIPRIYGFLQQTLARRDTRREIAERYIRARPGDTVLDVGCGPGAILPYLPPVTYVGIDSSARYIASASSRYGQRGRFVQMDASAITARSFGTFDLVLVLGLLHHLDDRAAQALLRTLRTVLREKGRVVTVDGAFTSDQGLIERLLLHADRGRHVRDIDRYRSLAMEVFPTVVVHVRHDLLRLPYTHLIMECANHES